MGDQKVYFYFSNKPDVSMKRFCHTLSFVYHRGTKGILLFFFKRSERYNQEVLSHSFICLLLPHMEGIVLVCNIDLYCATAIFSGHR